jgi:hypothetical protein
VSDDKLLRKVFGPTKAWVCDCSLAVGSNPTGSVPVSCQCCMMSGRGLRDGLVTRPEECGVSECDPVTSTMRRPSLARAVESWRKVLLTRK